MKSNLAKRFLVALSVATMLFSNTVSARSYSGDDSAKEELSNIVVLAKFKDQKSNDFYAKNSDGLRVDQQLLSDYNYLSKYIGDISYGNESIQNIFPHYNSKNKSIGVITLNLTESEAASKLIDEKIINEVVKRLNSSKSFINIDVDKNRDGYVDNLSIVLQGQSKYSTDVPSLWPHYFYVDQNSQVEKLNTITGNLAVKDYNILNTGETKNGGLGIIAHEYLHRLGYPDLYTSDGSTNPVGNWDVMAVNSRGNGIIFRGADDPLKIKSIKVAKFPIARLWIEEAAEFKTEDEVSIIVNSVLRSELPDGLFYKIYYTYNPPKVRQSWVNVKYESAIIADNTKVYHSTYLDNPYISQAFIDEAEHVKKMRPLKYDWEYMGKAIGSGVVPFDNLVFERISDEEIKNFDNIRQGCDFGYAFDPVAWVRLHYDKTRRRIYIFDEIYGVKISNRELAQMIKDKGLPEIITIFDSAEPKSIDEISDYGVWSEGAIKGADSVAFGEKWLDDLDAIIIDPVRCPNTTREFETIDYATDRFGNPVSRLEDKNNHTIDAVRYALSRDMKGSTFSFN